MTQPKKTPYDPEERANLPLLYGDTPTFLGVDPIDLPEGAKKRDVVFFGVPWEGPVTWGGYSGCELAVKSVRQASARYGAYLPEYDLDAADSLSLADAGDVAVTPGDSAATMASIRRTAADIVAAGAKPFAFGGDHSYTPEIIAALAEQADGPIGVIHLDAHMDNMPEFGGDAMARCAPLYRTVRLPNVRAESVVHFGIRGPRNSPFQTALAREAGSRIMTIKEIRDLGFDQAVSEAMKTAGQGTSAVYLTICSDILEAAYNPGGPPDFGGLNPQELFSLINRVAQDKMAGMDFVEIYPPQDPLGRSSHLVAWAFTHALCGLAAIK